VQWSENFAGAGGVRVFLGEQVVRALALAESK